MKTSRAVKPPSRRDTERVDVGSGNVFEDIRVSDSAVVMVKAELVSRIKTIIGRRGLTQSKAARILGVNQPKVSALVRGNLDGFSTDRLFRFLNALGSDIEIAVKPRSRSGSRPTIRVVKERLAG